MKLLAALTAASCLLTTAASASDLSNTNSDKSQYNLFNPTPRDLMRPMNSDEYDNVFDAHTLDAGHFQIEGSLIDYYHYSAHYDFTGEAYRFEEYEYSWEPRFRVGLLNNVDFEVRPTYEIRSENYNGAYFSPYAPYASTPQDVSATLNELLLGQKSILGKRRRSDRTGHSSLPFRFAPVRAFAWRRGYSIWRVHAVGTLFETRYRDLSHGQLPSHRLCGIR